MVLMREIKHFIQEGHIDSTSGKCVRCSCNSLPASDDCGAEYAKKLQSMARHGDEELLDIFTASFDGISFNRDTFDVKFFVTNSRDLVQERSKQQQ